MSFSTWEAIARRHFWYRELLHEWMKEWPEERVYACTDMRILLAVIKLTERVERHRDRTDRHMERGMAALPVKDTRRH